MSSENRYEEEGTAKHLMNAMLNQIKKYEEKYQEIISELFVLFHLCVVNPFSKL